jgi:hypothetical protein
VKSNEKYETSFQEESMGRKIALILSFLTVFLLSSGSNIAAVESIYGHISFVDNEATVTRADGSENQAVVNLPVIPGDTVATSAAGRCELQFDNGTVIRLDENSRLRITTVQAPTLTSRWKITTLHLLQGQAYALPQTYNREMFQIITPNAAVKLKSRTAATIRFDTDLRTTLFSDAGKFEVLYGADSKTLKTAKVKAGQAVVIDTANTLAVSSEKRNLEFVAWNEYVDRHFKELHYGISKVPPKLKFGSSALRYWAEKWSSLFGEWIYDEVFGYVWKPADERFAYAERPFFHADFVRINGQLFLVPQQAWGWVPAHMGTWVWMKRGWTWIPGEWFHPGIVDYQGSPTFPTLSYYLMLAYGDIDLYNIFCQNDLNTWRLEYLRIFKRQLAKPALDVLPPQLAKIIKRVNKVPAADAAKRLGLDRTLSVVGMDKLPPERRAKLANAIPDAAGKARPVSNLEARNEIRQVGENGEARDWNPDARWAAKSGLSIQYSSSTNAVVCPELKISSDRPKGVGRMLLREAASHQPEYSPTEAVQEQSSNNSDPADRAATSTQDDSGQREKKDDKGK